MQGNWTVCVPLKYFICMPDIQEAKCLESTVQILPPPRSFWREGAKNFDSRKFRPLPYIYVCIRPCEYVQKYSFQQFLSGFL